MISPRILLSLLFTAITLAPLPARAAEAGAWETFSTLDNANAWGVFDFSDEITYYPQWAGETPGDEIILFQHVADNPLWFFTDTLGNAGGGKLVGDYATPEIQGILAELYVDAIEEFDQIDCAIYTTGPAGTTYYFSISYYDTDLGGAGWHTLRFGFFDQPWFFFNGTSYVQAPVTEQFLSTIQEIGFRFIPREGTTVNSLAALDNVMLEPRVPTPLLSHDRRRESPDRFHTGREGHLHGSETPGSRGTRLGHRGGGHHRHLSLPLRDAGPSGCQGVLQGGGGRHLYPVRHAAALSGIRHPRSLLRPLFGTGCSALAPPIHRPIPVAFLPGAARGAIRRAYFLYLTYHQR